MPYEIERLESKIILVFEINKSKEPYQDSQKTGYGHLFLREDKKSLKITNGYSEAVSTEVDIYVFHYKVADTNHKLIFTMFNLQ
jgi:hypothetical protein